MAYSISEQAAEDIYWLFEQGKRQFGERSAIAYQALLGEAVIFAATYPLASPLRDTINGPVRVRYFGSHIIAYDVEGEDIVVVRVFHQSQDWGVDT